MCEIKVHTQGKMPSHIPVRKKMLIHLKNLINSEIANPSQHSYNEDQTSPCALVGTSHIYTTADATSGISNERKCIMAWAHYSSMEKLKFSS